MKQGLTLSALAARVADEQTRKRDIVADTRTMQFSSNGVTRLLVDEAESVSEFDVTEHAHGQIATHIGVPKRYYDRMRSEAPKLLDQNANHWLHTQTGPKGDSVRRMLRTFTPLPGEETAGVVRGFLSDRYKRLDYADLLEHVMPVLAEIGVDNGSVVSCNLSDTRFYLKVLCPRIFDEVNVGDVVQAGVVISNSEVGAGALGVEPLVFTLACKNGMIVADKTMRRYHVGRRIEDSEEAMAVFSDKTLALDDAALFAKVGDVVRAAADQAKFSMIVAGLRDLAAHRVTRNPVEAVEVLAKRATLTEDESGSILEHLIEGADLSAYGYLNAVTRAAQDVPEYERATELERLGGQILATPELVLA